MEIRIAAGDITAQPVHAIVVNLFEGVTQPGGATGAVDRALDGTITRLMAEGEIKGKLHEFHLIHTFGKIAPGRVVVAGLGKTEDFTLDLVRIVAGEAARFLRRIGVERAATIVHGAGLGGLETEKATQALVEGTILGLYRFRRHITKNQDEEKDLQELVIVEREETKIPVLERGLERGKIIVEATCLARDLANEPGNYMTPSDLAEAARSVAKECGLQCQVLEREQMQELNMGGLLGVAQGSTQPPKFIILNYRHAEAPAGKPPLGLVGKGITFDSGGISIKPAEGMGEMKGDMSGGAAVIAALGAIGKLKPKINVTGLVPATENLLGGSAYKPGDILKTHSGKTIEVINTDAEGRLILADALAYGRTLGLSPMVDIATLTGACMVALGEVCAGIMGSDQSLIDRVITLGKEAGEKYWQLPLFDEYKEQIKSDCADMKNTGGRWGGAITAALLLAEFAENTPWVHLDIAGLTRTDKELGYLPKGATGFGVRTFVNLALGLAED